MYFFTYANPDTFKYTYSLNDALAAAAHMRTAGHRRIRIKKNNYNPARWVPQHRRYTPAPRPPAPLGPDLFARQEVQRRQEQHEQQQQMMDRRW